MAVDSTSWEDVGKRFEALGARLRADIDAMGDDAVAERAELEKSLRAVLSAMEDIVTAAGKAVRDPSLRKDLLDLATSVREALLSTFQSATSQARERLGEPVRRTREIAGKQRERVAARAPRLGASKTSTAKAGHDAEHPVAHKKPAKTTARTHKSES